MGVDFGTQIVMNGSLDRMLRYGGPVVLVGASGTSIEGALAALPGEWPLLAADGGANALVRLGRTPQLVIGDMDSIEDIPETIERLELPGQDDTDLEKCLKRINAPLIVGLGLLGARLDHTLGAIHALAQIRHARPVILVGDRDVLVRVKGDIAFKSEPGMRVSVWPLARQRFAGSSGLKWPLDGLEMTPGKSVGISNEATGRRIEIRAEGGAGYALILPLDRAEAMIAMFSQKG